MTVELLRRVASFCLAFTVAACSAPTSSGPLAAPVPRAYFGMHIHRAAQPAGRPDGNTQYSAWPEVGFGAWRLWDAYVAWPNLEPQKNKWDFSTLDRYVAMATLAKVEVLLPLGMTPTWASARPRESSAYKPGNAAEVYSLADWEAYVRAVALRYKGRIKTYQVWNEANYKHFYSGDPGRLVEMAKSAYEILKQTDPEVTVVSPSVSGERASLKWFDDYLARGGGTYADVISYHLYVPKKAPEAMLPLIRDIQAIMEKRGVGHKPLWNTETGWRIENKTRIARVGAAGADWRELDAPSSAAYVARALVLAWAAGVSRFYWYAWDNADMGLVDATDQSLKPAGAAYARTVDWMLGSTFSACSPNGPVWVCDMTDSTGKRARIVWREDGLDPRWTIPGEWKAASYQTLAGDITLLSGNRATISLGPSPVLIR